VRDTTESRPPPKYPARAPEIVARTTVIAVAIAAISSELRPPYRSRTAMSRPFWSAPRKKRPCQVGPMGMPDGETTSCVWPPNVTVSVTWLSAGPVCATYFEYSGAARHMAAITRNTAPNASAVWSRLRRRNASCQGPAPAAGLEMRPGTAGRRASGGWSSVLVAPGTWGLLLELEAGPVGQVERVEDRRTEVDLVRHEVRQLLGPVDRL